MLVGYALDYDDRRHEIMSRWLARCIETGASGDKTALCCLARTILNCVLQEVGPLFPDEPLASTYEKWIVSNAVQQNLEMAEFNNDPVGIWNAAMGQRTIDLFPFRPTQRDRQLASLDHPWFEDNGIEIKLPIPFDRPVETLPPLDHKDPCPVCKRHFINNRQCVACHREILHLQRQDDGDPTVALYGDFRSSHTCVSFPVYGPIDQWTITATDLAKFCAALPILAGAEISFDHKSPHAFLKSDDSQEYLQVPGLPSMTTNADLGSAMSNKWALWLFSAYLEKNKNEKMITTAVDLLVAGMTTEPPAVGIVLTLGALESICSLGRDEQAQKRICECVSLLYPTPERREVYDSVKEYYKIRNKIVHGTWSLSIGESAIHLNCYRLVADILRRRITANMLDAQTSELTLGAILNRYVEGEQSIRSLCDSMPVSHSFSAMRTA